MRLIMRGVALSSFLVLAFLFAATNALAGQPTIQRFPVDTTTPDSVDCAFPVQIHIVGTDVQVIWTIQGDVHEFDAFAGGYATLTNLDTSKTITVNIAGPGHFTFAQDGRFRFVGTGTSLFAMESTPGIEWFQGRFVLSVDAQGNSTFTTVGTERDLCSELAP